MESEGRHKLHGRIYPAERWEKIEEVFPASSAKQDFLNNCQKLGSMQNVLYCFIPCIPPKIK